MVFSGLPRAETQVGTCMQFAWTLNISRKNGSQGMSLHSTHPTPSCCIPLHSIPTHPTLPNPIPPHAIPPHPTPCHPTDPILPYPMSFHFRLKAWRWGDLSHLWPLVLAVWAVLSQNKPEKSMLNPVVLRESSVTTSAFQGNSGHCGHCGHPALAQNPEFPVKVLGCEKVRL